MKIHFLGTNGWYDSATGETPSILIDAKEAYVILDAGNSLRKIDTHISDKSKPILLFLSHFHLDHVFGLHIMPKFSFRQGITIYGQPGTKEVLARLFSHPFTAALPDLCKKMRLEIKDIREGMNLLPSGSQFIPVEARFLVHADPCMGYSFALEGKKITYCTDTGACGNLNALANGADLLITECAWKTRNQSPDWPHLAPEDAAEAARDSGAKRLILTHLDANQYRTQGQRKEAQARARKIFKRTVVAKDNLVVEL
jgi:ribonuclease BN (tRNA processing enzyme)